MTADVRAVTLSLSPDEEADVSALARALATALRVDVAELPRYVVRRRSLDCRRGRVRFVHHVEVEPTPEPPLRPLRVTERDERVYIVGDGPTGLFCAYELARFGVGSTVLERGKPVQPRRKDLKGLTRKGTVNPDSNYCFGEGGAGTYSDGKLYTRSHKRGDVRDVLRTLVHHGAPDAILVDARPHIGSNRLPQVVSSMRAALEAEGVQFRFDSRVSAIARERPGRHVVHLHSGERLEAAHLVLATGHSARDVFVMLQQIGVPLEAKPFAVGVRVEHPQTVVNSAQYGRHAQHPSLPAAYYKLVDSRQEPPVFSFCMCPGGFIVPASTSPGELVVNGMSLSRRDSRYANSGIVVGVTLEALARAGFVGPLAGVEAQAAIERAAWDAGSGLAAPATRIPDFLRGRASSSVPDSSYVPGLVATDLSTVLDCTGLALVEPLRRGIQHFGKQLEGFVRDEAVLVGVESRTSCPVRVVRDERCSVPGFEGLYPAGEGAGYAGGIMSAALDGIRVARSILRQCGVSID